MRKIKFIAIFLCIAIISTLCGCDLALYREIGNPQFNRYPKDSFSRTSCDMIYYNDYIYLGGGNYDTNTGPVDIWRYNLKTSEFELSGTVPDEEISRFYIFNDTLYACGTDPKDTSWEIGGYYYLDNDTDTWVSVRNIQNAVHNFDLAYYDNTLFAGLCVLSGKSPVVSTKDNGKTFSDVYFYKDTKLDTSNWDNNNSEIRVYDFFEFNGELYADLFLMLNNKFSFEIFKYENNSFKYICSFNFKMKYVSNLWINGKCEYKGKYYISTGYLLCSDDMINFTDITPKNETTCTIKVFDNELYLLTTSTNETNKFYNKIYKYNDRTEKFEKQITFTYTSPAINFCKINNNFYLSIGSMVNKYSDSGKIVKIS